MAQFFKAKPNQAKKLSQKIALKVQRLDHLGAGIAEHQGKVVFIPGALPGETVEVQLTEQKKNYARAKLQRVSEASPDRQTPPCPWYGKCGGCDLQHLSLPRQLEYKRQALGDIVSRSAAQTVTVNTDEVSGDSWHYRRRARLATLLDKETNQLALGFREEGSKSVVGIDSCAVLARPLSELISPFATLLNRLKGKQRLGHLELTQAANGLFAVLRVTAPLAQSDKKLLSAFADERQIALLLQGNEGELEFLSSGHELPYYQLDGLKLAFAPGNFIQVNGEVNQAMVAQAMNWLDVHAGERVLDLFCGVGNFSLPLAKQGAEVVGVEGVPEMVAQAKQNAAINGLDNLSFYCADLSEDLAAEPWLGKIDKLLLDPARAGAYESLKWLKKMKPAKVLYVSCNPASLARDSVLLFEAGYQLTRLGLVDMFPQTHHSEGMALFELVN
ncbi:23S rRNA (uracil(1939)-C(5))-methyltransferase RlmD [Shewanella amazonensis]|uniref:23S rRNA (uracil(1939)-C(5))-methyltransferase RlmD n=1 Tax=Shewanella amazonensis (strain ATCC BAA-1098 / SB2B) TaxID=326297 RepID=RLMD_SHEAM|nr:23S rRNA (uracil(1939)-C(5))-methyltransferase RlmD [Shewanella amazonensis]A1S4D3.1 RecName: Full=23S rRNA (uracil(1939)-C(5))-methyltransferase RlmD; AltName: Full=23S rRNA(m5U1939)-methyltransferase [Shewanella amazonensis SB2B]ABL99239.1 23S rRNA (uracil-5-)-methyltransferase RumA [Shewanella amazonensis SB2B]